MEGTTLPSAGKRRLGPVLAVVTGGFLVSTALAVMTSNLLRSEGVVSFRPDEQSGRNRIVVVGPAGATSLLFLVQPSGDTALGIKRTDLGELPLFGVDDSLSTSYFPSSGQHRLQLEHPVRVSGNLSPAALGRAPRPDEAGAVGLYVVLTRDPASWGGADHKAYTPDPALLKRLSDLE